MMLLIGICFLIMKFKEVKEEHCQTLSFKIKLKELAYCCYFEILVLSYGFGVSVFPVEFCLFCFFVLFVSNYYIIYTIDLKTEITSFLHSKHFLKQFPSSIVSNHMFHFNNRSKLCTRNPTWQLCLPALQTIKNNSRGWQVHIFSFNLKREPSRSHIKLL